MLGGVTCAVSHASTAVRSLPYIPKTKRAETLQIVSVVLEEQQLVVLMCPVSCLMHQGDDKSRSGFV